MASNVQQALGQLSGYQVADPYSQGLGKLRYQAANIEKEDVGKSDLHQVFDAFLGAAKKGVNTYDQYLQQDAKKQFAEAQAKVAENGDPNALKDAITQGTIGHHENPYTQQFIYSSAGQEAQLQGDDKTNLMVQQGHIPASGPEFEEMKRQNRIDAIQLVGDKYGIKTEIPEFQQGFSKNLSQSNEILDRNYNKALSDKTQKNALYSMQSQLNSIAESSMTPDQKVQASQLIISKAQGDLILTDPDQIQKTVDYVHQLYASDPETMKQLSNSVMQVGFYAEDTTTPDGKFHKKGDPRFDSVKSLVGGEAVVIDRQNQANNFVYTNNTNEATALDNTLHPLETTAITDGSSALGQLNQAESEWRSSHGYTQSQKLPPDVQGKFDQSRAKIYQIIQTKNTANKEKNDKAIAQDQANQLIRTKMNDAMLNGTSFDEKNIAGVPVGVSSENIHKAIEDNAATYLNDNIINGKDAKGQPISDTERTRRFIAFSNLGSGDSNSITGAAIRGVLRDANRELKSGQKDTPRFDLVRRMLDTDPQGLSYILADEGISGKDGADVYAAASTMKAGGMSKEDLQMQEQLKRDNPVLYKNDSDAVATRLYGKPSDKDGNPSSGVNIAGMTGASAQTYYNIVRASYAKTHNIDLAVADGENWKKTNTVQVDGGTVFGLGSQTATFPLTSTDIGGSQNRPIVLQSLSKRIQDHGASKVIITPDSRGNFDVYDLNNHNNHFTVYRDDLTSDLNAEIKKGQDERVKAESKLQNRATQ